MLQSFFLGCALLCRGHSSSGPLRRPPPEDWAGRVRSGRMLYTEDDSKVGSSPGEPTSTDWSEGWGRHAQIGNGVLGTIVDSGVLYMSGTFDSAAIATAKTAAQPFPQGSRPHLARVPSSMAVTITNGTVYACAVDMLTGTYYRRSSLAVAVGKGKSTSSTATIEQRWYAHRTRKNLIVMELELLSIAGSGGGNVTVGLTMLKIGNETNADVAWSTPKCAAAGAAAAATSDGNAWCRAGVTLQAEDGTMPGTNRIAYVRTPVPRTVSLHLGAVAENVSSSSSSSGGGGSVAYYFGVAESSAWDRGSEQPATMLQRALSNYEAVSSLSDAGKAALLPEHQAAWTQLWSTATVELDTDNNALRRAVNSTIYGIFSLHDETDYQPYPGTPLDGITLGSFGHWGGCYLWDADMWMHPAIAPWRPDFMAKMLQYRADRLPEAMAQAAANGHAGAKFPWQSCGTGRESCSGSGNITYLGYQEIHISADIAFEASQYWRLTGKKNITWARAVGFPLAAAIADYYASRAAPRQGDPDQHALHLDNVMGPDEHHSAVNDSAYDNGGAIMALKFAIELAATLRLHDAEADPAALPQQPGSQKAAAVGGDVDAKAGGSKGSAHNTSLWKDVASRLVIPYSAAHDFHPEYEGLSWDDKTFEAKQADTLMLQYPLMYDGPTMTATSKENDLMWYKNRSEYSPDMTAAVYATVALELGHPEIAQELFDSSYQRFNFPPYGTWTENADGGGNIPYLTSGSGFLQSVVYGFGGLRALNNTLRIAPQLPAGVTRVAFRRLAYCGAHVDVVYNATVATLTHIDGPQLDMPQSFPTGTEAHITCAQDGPRVFS